MWLTRVLLTIEEQPLGHSAPCLNPECDKPVDFTGARGTLYCSHYCRTRTSRIRRAASQQIEVLEELLDRPEASEVAPELVARVAHLRWWLARLGTRYDRMDP